MFIYWFYYLMNEITYHDYKFIFELNDSTLNIQINNIINNNLFTGSINKKSIDKFHNLILNALSGTENFNIIINEEIDLIKIVINYDTCFVTVEETFTLNKINEIDNLKKNIAMLISQNEQLEQQIKDNNDNIAMLISQNKQLEQKIKQLANNTIVEQKIKQLSDNTMLEQEMTQLRHNIMLEQEIHQLTLNNNVNLSIDIGKDIDPYYGTLFHFFDDKSQMMYDFSYYCEQDGNVNNSVYMINYNKITINTMYIKKNDKTQKQHHIALFLQMYSMINKHIINQIIITGKNYKNKIVSNIIETLSGLTNYKEITYEK